MSSLSASSLESGASGAQPLPYQERLMNFCRSQGIGTANFQLVSDKRGWRTAWSCIIYIECAGQFHARFWYDWSHTNNALEDAAERALEVLGVIPTPLTLASAAQQQRLGGRYFSVQEASHRANGDDKSGGGRTPGRGQTISIPQSEHSSTRDIRLA